MQEENNSLIAFLSNHQRRKIKVLAFIKSRNSIKHSITVFSLCFVKYLRENGLISASRSWDNSSQRKFRKKVIYDDQSQNKYILLDC